MNVAQSCEIKRRQYRKRHILGAADNPLLRTALFRTCYELMADQHIADRRIDLAVFHHAAHRLFISRCFAARNRGPNLDRFDKRQQMDRHRAEFVFCHDGLKPSFELVADMHPGSFQQLRKVADTLARIVVAADHEHLDPQIRQPIQEFAHQFHSIALRRRCLVDISRDQADLRLFPLGDFQDLQKRGPLILQQIIAVKPFAQMQIRDMKQFHRLPPKNKVLDNKA